MQHGVWLDRCPCSRAAAQDTVHCAQDRARGGAPAAGARGPACGAADRLRQGGARRRRAAAAGGAPLESLAKLVSALPAVQLHWDKVTRLWKKSLAAASILLLAWAVFILFAD